MAMASLDETKGTSSLVRWTTGCGQAEEPLGKTICHSAARPTLIRIVCPSVGANVDGDLRGWRLKVRSEEGVS